MQPSSAGSCHNGPPFILCFTNKFGTNSKVNWKLTSHALPQDCMLLLAMQAANLLATVCCCWSAMMFLHAAGASRCIGFAALRQTAVDLLVYV